MTTLRRTARSLPASATAGRSCSPASRVTSRPTACCGRRGTTRRRPRAARLPESGARRAQYRHILRRELELRRLEDIGELGEAGDGDDRRGDAADQPGQRHLRVSRLVPGRDLADGVENAAAARVEVLFQARPARRIAVGIGGGVIFAGEETGGEAIVRDDADGLLPADRFIAGFEFAAV